MSDAADPAHGACPLNAEQQAVWATVQALNQAWTRGHPETLLDFFHPQMVAITPQDRLRREGATACIAGWQAFVEAAKIDAWREIDPLVRVFGNAAVVSYYYEISFEMNGRSRQEGGRDLFFLVREAGRWQVVADQFSGWP